MAAFTSFDLSSHQVVIEHALRDAGFTVERADLDAKSGVVVDATRDGRAVSCHVRPERQGAWLEMSIAWTGVPVVLSLRPELAGEAFDKLLGMTVDLKVNDRAFDTRFVIEAAPPAVAPRLLVDSVRAALMALPSSDEGPVLRLGDGRLVVAWRAEPDAATLRDIAAMLASMAQAGDAMVEGFDAVLGVGPFRAGDGGHATVDPHARESGQRAITAAHRRAVAFLSTAAIAGAGFLAAVLSGARLH